MEIRSKAEFYSLWSAGFLGNHTRVTTSITDALAWDSPNGVGFREVGKGGGGNWERHHRYSDIIDCHYRWKAVGRPFIMDDGVPNYLQTLIGEVCRTYRGWEGFLGITTNLMRIAMAKKELKPLEGAAVFDLIRNHMDATSLDCLLELFELYPDATIEFACYSVPVGALGWNTMFWEVRNY